MVKDKEAVEKSLDRWLIQTAREHNCYKDEIAVIAFEHLNNERHF